MSPTRCSRTKARRLGMAICKLQQEQGAGYGQDSLCLELNMSKEELAGLMEEVRPVRVVSLDKTDCEDHPQHEIIPDDCCVLAPDALEGKEIISLLVERMAQLPDMQKKVLAMCYYENMKLSEIAALFGVTVSRISQIHREAVAVLRKYLTNLWPEPRGAYCL